MTIAHIVHGLGGFAQKQQLVARGARDVDLTRAVRSGEVIRARQGWYTTLSPQDPAVRAVRVGGRLTGLSAIEQAGGWVIRSRYLHVSVPRNGARHRSPSNRHRRLRAGTSTVRHWDDVGVLERGTASSVSVADALYRVVLDESFEQAVAALDWALHTGVLDEIDFETLMLALPENLRAVREWVDAACESLPESLARTRLRIAGHHVEIQAELPTGEFVDLVVDRAIGLEVDGRRWHEGSFDRDRNKDITITLERMHGLRPAASTVFADWARLYAAICVALGERGIPLPSETQDIRTGRRRRVPRLRSLHVRRAAEVLNFQKEHGNSHPPHALNPA